MINALVCTILFLLVVKQCNSNQNLECPSEYVLEFCQCHRASAEKGLTTVICQSIPSLPQLRREVRELTEGFIEHFYVTNSQLGYLPGNAFLGTRIKRLEISSTELTGLTEGDEDALMGQRDFLKELVLHYCKLTNKVGWYRLEEMVALQSLDLSFNPLEEILEDTFSRPPENLKELYLKGCNIKFLSSEAFSSIKKLVVLDLSENFITQIARSMFPQLGNLLQYLYLSSNSIKELPRGVFTNMTGLKTVYAGSNGLRYMPEDVWGDIWDNSPRTVDFMGNDIQCDEGLCWLTFRDASFLRGSCADPDAVRGRRFLTLWPWDVRCNETLYHGNLSLPYKPPF